MRTITINGREVTVRPLTWGELKRLRADDSAPPDAVLEMVLPAAEFAALDDAPVPEVKGLIDAVWNLTNGSPEQAGN